MFAGLTLFSAGVGWAVLSAGPASAWVGPGSLSIDRLLGIHDKLTPVQAEHRGGRSAADPVGPVGQHRHGLQGGASGGEDQPQPPQRGRAESLTFAQRPVMPVPNPRGDRLARTLPVRT
jgi:hypothetical protein